MMMISEDNSRQLESGREKAAQPTRFVEHLALSLSSNFMAADLGSLEGKVHQVLQSLSVSTGSDYIYLLVFNTNGQSPKFQLEWSDEEFYPVDQANSNSIDHRSSWFFNRLRDYHLPENRLTDESQNIDVSSESVWQVTGIKTLLLIP
jgi:hypothetical protein